MDAIEARLKCLDLAVGAKVETIGDDGKPGDKAENYLATAKKWAEFVVGGPMRESKRAGAPRGADER